MFDSDLFTNQFWNGFIIAATLGGIIGLIALILWMSGGKRPKADEQVKTMGHVWDGDLEELNNPLPLWWLGLFYITLIFGVIYLILYPGLGSFAGVLGWTQEKQYRQEIKAAENRYGPMYEKYQNQPITELVKNEHAVSMGQRLFMTHCPACHGSDAGGGPGYPNLRDDDWLYGGQPQSIKTSIMQGRQGVMPPWAPVLGEQGVKEMTEYVKSLSGLNHDAAAAEKGKEHFNTNCAACHGPNGEGNNVIGAPNLTDETWLYRDPGQSLEYSILKTIAEGRKGNMPAHGEFLGEAKVHLLATYLYDLSAAEKSTSN